MDHNQKQNSDELLASCEALLEHDTSVGVFDERLSRHSVQLSPLKCSGGLYYSSAPLCSKFCDTSFVREETFLVNSSSNSSSELDVIYDCDLNATNSSCDSLILNDEASFVDNVITTDSDEPVFTNGMNKLFQSQLWVPSDVKNSSRSDGPCRSINSTKCFVVSSLGQTRGRKTSSTIAKGEVSSVSLGVSSRGMLAANATDKTCPSQRYATHILPLIPHASSSQHRLVKLSSQPTFCEDHQLNILPKLYHPTPLQMSKNTGDYSKNCCNPLILRAYNSINYIQSNKMWKWRHHPYLRIFDEELRSIKQTSCGMPCDEFDAYYSSLRKIKLIFKHVLSTPECGHCIENSSGNVCEFFSSANSNVHKVKEAITEDIFQVCDTDGIYHAELAIIKHDCSTSEESEFNEHNEANFIFMYHYQCSLHPQCIYTVLNDSTSQCTIFQIAGCTCESLCGASSTVCENCKCYGHCASEVLVPCDELMSNVGSWQLTLLKVGSQPDTSASKICCDSIKGSCSCTEVNSAYADEEVTGCVKVIIEGKLALHFPVLNAEKYSEEFLIAPNCDEWLQDISNVTKMAHLQRSASEICSNSGPRCEHSSRFYAFKLMKNERETVRKLLPYFIEKSKKDVNYIPFRCRKLSVGRVESLKRRSDVGDVFMYREPTLKNDSEIDCRVSSVDVSPQRNIRVCGTLLGQQPISSSGNVFSNLKKIVDGRCSTPPASPSASIFGTASSSPHQRFTVRDCSAPPGTLPVTFKDESSHQSEVNLFADTQKESNTQISDFHTELLKNSESNLTILALKSKYDERSQTILSRDDIKINTMIEPSTVAAAQEPDDQHKFGENQNEFKDNVDSHVSEPPIALKQEIIFSNIVISEVIQQTENDFSPTTINGYSNDSGVQDSANTDTMQITFVKPESSEILNIAENTSEIEHIDNCAQDIHFSTSVKFSSDLLCNSSQNLDSETGAANNSSKQLTTQTSEISVAVIDRLCHNEQNIHSTSVSQYEEKTLLLTSVDEIPTNISDNHPSFTKSDIVENVMLETALPGQPLFVSTSVNSPCISTASENFMIPIVIASLSFDRFSSAEPTTISEKKSFECKELDSESTHLNHNKIAAGTVTSNTIILVDDNETEFQPETTCEILPDITTCEILPDNSFPVNSSSESTNHLPTGIISIVPSPLCFPSASSSQPSECYEAVSEANMKMITKLSSDSICSHNYSSCQSFQSNGTISSSTTNNYSTMQPTCLPSPKQTVASFVHLNNISPCSISLPFSAHNVFSSTCPSIETLPCVPENKNATFDSISFNSSGSNRTAIDLELTYSNADSANSFAGPTTCLESPVVHENSFHFTHPTKSHEEIETSIFSNVIIVTPYCVASEAMYSTLSAAPVPPVDVSKEQSIPIGGYEGFRSNQRNICIVPPLISNYEPTSNYPMLNVDNRFQIPDVSISSITSTVVSNRFVTASCSSTTPAVKTGNIPEICIVKNESFPSSCCDQIIINRNDLFENGSSTIAVTFPVSSPSTLKHVADLVQCNKVNESIIAITNPSHTSRSTTIAKSTSIKRAAQEAEIAHLYGAEQFKPRPIAFPIDVIRSNTLCAKTEQIFPRSVLGNNQKSTFRSKSTSPMTTARNKQHNDKRFQSSPPINCPSKLHPKSDNSSEISEIKLVCLPDMNQNENTVITTPQKTSFVHTVYVDVPSTYDANSDNVLCTSTEVLSKPPLYVSEFTRVTYGDIACMKQQPSIVKTELKLPDITHTANSDTHIIPDWLNSFVDQIIQDIINISIKHWIKLYKDEAKPLCSNKSYNLLNDGGLEAIKIDTVELAPSPDIKIVTDSMKLIKSESILSIANDSSTSSLAFIDDSTDRVSITACVGDESASSADRKTGLEDASASTSDSSNGSESWWAPGGPVACRDQLPLKNLGESLKQETVLSPGVPNIDRDKGRYGSDDDFDAMDEDMRRLEEKIHQFEHELEEDLEICLRNDDLNMKKMPNFSLLDKTKLTSSPLPLIFPPVCSNKSKHISLMSKKDILEYLDSESESDGDSSSKSDVSDVLFVSRKIKIKPGDRRCRSLDLKKRTFADECKSEYMKKMLSLTKSTGKQNAQGTTIDIKVVKDFETGLIFPSACTSGDAHVDDFRMAGCYWRESDGIGQIDSMELADFYANSNPSGVLFIFEDDCDEECGYQSFGGLSAFDTTPIASPVVSNNVCPPVNTIATNPIKCPFIEVHQSPNTATKFVSSFKNNFLRATKNIGPKLNRKSSKPSILDSDESLNSSSKSSIDPSILLADLISKTSVESGLQESDKIKVDLNESNQLYARSLKDSDVDNFHATPVKCIVSDAASISKKDVALENSCLLTRPDSSSSEKSHSHIPAPKPPIRQSSFDAVVSYAPSVHRHNERKTEEHCNRFIGDLPRVVPPPPCVPPRNSTLNYYPVRSHPISIGNKVNKNDFIIDCLSDGKQSEFPSNQSDAGGGHKATSIRHLKRKQMEHKMELEEEERNQTSGCSFCIRRCRTLQDARHGRYQQRRVSPHPRALTLPQRRSWPPRVSCSMLYCPRWSLPYYLHSRAISNFHLECDKVQHNTISVRKQSSCQSIYLSEKNVSYSDSRVSNSSLDNSSGMSTDSDHLWTPCSFPVAFNERIFSNDILLLHNSTSSSPEHECVANHPFTSCDECIEHDLNPVPEIQPEQCVTDSSVINANQGSLQNFGMVSRILVHRYSLPSTVTREPFADPVTVRQCCSCPLLIFYSVSPSLASDKLHQNDNSSESLNEAVFTPANCAPDTSPPYPTMAYSASESDISSN